MEVLNFHMGQMASLIGSLTVVGGALMWIYHKLIGKPRERRKQREENERQEQQLKMIKQENKPLIETIEELKNFLDESRRDREKLNRIAVENSETLDEHDKRLDNHNNRLIVLESKTGLRYGKGGD